MPRPIHALIDLAAVRHNYRVVRARVPNAKMWAVVKANGYGHGVGDIARALADEADGFALLCLEDALNLRSQGVRQPMLLLEGFFDADQLPAISEQGITVVLHRMDQVRVLADCGLPLAVYLKINTGMNRLGIEPAECAEALGILRAAPQVQSITLMTHFADADGLGVAEPLACFRETTGAFGLPECLANSASLLRFPETHGAWVRPGVVLYGASPMPAIATAEALGLKPVMTLASELIAVRDLKQGDAVGYCGTFTAERPMRMGVVACGYADGYPRHAGTGTPVLVGGVRTRLLGRVSMDMLAVDVTDVPGACVGAPVVLWGRGLPADEVAAVAGTISYELLTGLARRVPRRVIEVGQDG